MTREEALKIITNEQLDYFNWYEDRDIRSDEVGIKKISNKWIVYSTDERASIISEKTFLTETEALENFIKRLRADKILREFN